METETPVQESTELPVGMADEAEDQESDPRSGNGFGARLSDRAYKENQDRIPGNLEAFKDKLQRETTFGKTFELQIRELPFGESRFAFLFLTVFSKDTVLAEVLKRLSQLDPSAVSHEAVESYLSAYVPAMQVKKTDSFSEMINQVMMGDTAFYIDGQAAVLMIDAKQFPLRNPDEPALERVVRGSKDGFTETLLVNVGLVRRRLRDKKAVFEMMKVGIRSHADVCIGYIEDIADPKLVEAVRDKIKKVKIDGIPLADKQLEEMALRQGWNPYPLVRYTERPDVVAAQMLDGSVVIMTDTSPSAMMLPTTFFDLMQHAEENRQSPLTGTYLRWVRFLGILLSMFLLPVWYLYAANTAVRPDWLWFVGTDETAQLPLILQFILAEIGVDLLRLASVHTPSPLVTAMTLLAAIMIGDMAVETGLFVTEVVLYMSISAIGMFATPSYELGLANRLVRLGLLAAVFLFKIPGLVIGTTILFVSLAFARSFNRPYLWPFVPFNAPALLSILLRRPLPANDLRPSFLRPKKREKQPV